MPVQETLTGAAYRPLDPERAPNVTADVDDTKGEKKVPYLLPGTKVPARKGTAFSFESLSEDDYAELGGVEYQALRALVWIVPGVRSILVPAHSRRC